jgi:predicted patatin/cPLA2 family phospholipase
VLVVGNDALLEWSPYLLQREVINTKFGLEWQPDKLAKITILNGKLATATKWNDILSAVTQMNGQTQIYVLSTNKSLLTALNKESTVSFRMKLETPAVQVGILSTQ